MNDNQFVIASDPRFVTHEEILDGPAFPTEHSIAMNSAAVSGKESSLHAEGNSKETDEQAEHSTSGVGLDPVIQTKANADPAGFMAEVKKNCKAALADIRSTNEKSHSVSAFLPIPAFIGFLAKLAFAENQTFLSDNNCQKNSKGVLKGFDKHAYIQFVERFILKNTSWKTASGHGALNVTPGISSVLYSIVRCGLLHGMTLVHPYSSFMGINVELTHDGAGKALTVYDAELKNRVGQQPILIVLNAFSLCDEIDKAIDRMFAECGNDAALAESIKRISVDEPTFRFYREYAVQTKLDNGR